MSGIKAWRTNNGDPPIIKEYFIRASQTIDELDPVALMSNTLTNRVIKPTSTEIDFQNATPAIAGLLGLIWHPVKTDASGILTTNVPSTIDPGAVVTYPVISYAGLIDRPLQSLSGAGTDIGNARVLVAIFNDEFEFLLDVAGSADAANQQVSRALIGTSIGLQVNGSGVIKCDASVSSGNAAGCVVVDVDDTQTNFNVANKNSDNAIWVRVKATHQQYLTGLLF